MESGINARRGLAIFFVVLIAGSACFEHKVLVLGGVIEHHLGLIYSLVWVGHRLIGCRTADPARVAARHLVSLGGRAGTRAVFVATTLPLVVGFVAYGIA